MIVNSAKNVLWLLLVLMVIALGAFYFLFSKNLLLLPEKKQEEKIIEKEQVIIGVSSLPNVYPQCAPEINEISFNSALYESLVDFDRENKIIPVLALKWDNPDNLTWRFYLNPEAKFSNGDRVTANDVKFTYDYLLAKRGELPLDISTVLPTVKAVSVIDESTVQFTTVSPDPVLLNRLATGFFVLSQKDIKSKENGTPLGSGPYNLTSVSDSQLILTRQENYWSSKPKIKKIVYQKVEEGKKLDALLNGEVDLVSYAYTASEKEKIKSIAQNSGLKTTQTLGGNFIYLDWDTLREKSPYIDVTPNPLLKKEVREAIYMGINIDKILEANQGSVALNQLASPAIFGYNPNIQRPLYDLAKAKALLAKAGYEKGFAMTIDYTNTPGAAEAFEVLKDEFANLNIKVTLNGIEQEKFFEKVTKKDTSAFIAPATFPTQDGTEILEGVFHSYNPPYGMYNLTYSNTEVDKKIEEIAAISDYATRKEKIQEIMKMVTDDVAKVPLFQGLIYYSSKKEIHYKPRLDGSLRVRDLAGVEI